MKRSITQASLLCVVMCLALPFAAYAAPPTYIEHVNPPGTAPLPFSDAVVAGDTLYLAGQIGIDVHTGNAAADPGSEARLVMEAVKRTLERAGLTMDELVSVTVFCTDLSLYDSFNTVYSGYFHGHHPARAFIGANKLVRGAHFEVMGVAIRKTP
jgi:2-iminobutanoate/2-iminopropanoate deaminase